MKEQIIDILKQYADVTTEEEMFFGDKTYLHTEDDLIYIAEDIIKLFHKKPQILNK